jgi:hypothetical protein
MNPLGTEAEHELDLAGDGPGLLEEQVRIPFGGVMAKIRGYTEFEFQPVLNRSDFDSGCRAEADCASGKVPVWSSTDLKYCGRIVVHRRLR